MPQVVQQAALTVDDRIDSDYFACDPPVIQDRVDRVRNAYNALCDTAARRREKLEESRRMHLFFATMSEELAWIRERMQLMTSEDTGRDLTSIHSLLTKQKVVCLILRSKLISFCQ